MSVPSVLERIQLHQRGDRVHGLMSVPSVLERIQLQKMLTERFNASTHDKIVLAIVCLNCLSKLSV
jgi:hypothetical protein